MAYRRIRIYEGIADDTSLIGASLSATDVFDDPAFYTFMANNGHTVTGVAADELPENSNYNSWRYVEVRPPLSNETLGEFGKLCLDIVDGGNSGVAVIDNRASDLGAPLDHERVVAIN